MAEQLKTIAEMLVEQTETEDVSKKDEAIEQEAEVKVEEPAAEVVKTEEKQEDKPEEKVEDTTEEKQKEPVEEEAPKEDQPVIEKKLYAGKFEKPEDLEKAYSELQSAFTKKSQNISEKVKETESLLDEREFEEKTNSVIEDKALDLIEKTFATITDKDVSAKAASMLMSYKSTGDMKYMDSYFNFLDPRVDRQLQKDLTKMALDVRQDFNSRRSELIYEPVKKELIEIESEDPEFLKENQEILVQVIRNNPKTSIRETRELIKQVEARAIEKYKKTLAQSPKVEKSPITPVQKALPAKQEDAIKKPERQMTVKEMLLND